MSAVSHQTALLMVSELQQKLVWALGCLNPLPTQNQMQQRSLKVL